MHLFNIIEILNKFKIFKYHQIKKFINIVDLRKLDFLNAEKISKRSGFVNKDVVLSCVVFGHILHFSWTKSYSLNMCEHQ